MDFTKIRLVGLSTVDFPISGALPSDMFILEEVDGLGPVAVDVNIVNTVLTGGLNLGRQPQLRQVVITVGLNPSYSDGQTVEQLRTILYGLLTPGVSDVVSVEIHNDTTQIAFTTGEISAMDPVYFTKDPQVQITIDCVQAYLQAPSMQSVVPTVVNQPTVYNVGTAPSGFKAVVIFTSAVSSWQMTSADSLTKMKFVYNFQAGDVLTFNTTYGKRMISVTRAGIISNKIDILSSDSIWFQLYGGLNAWTVNTSAFTWNTIKYVAQYWGV